MAMRKPGTSIIRFECDHEVAQPWKKHNVAAGRVRNRVDALARAKRFVCYLFDDSKIVSMQMDLNPMRINPMRMGV